MTTAGENKTLFQVFQENTGYQGEARSRLLLGELGNATEVDDPDALIGLNTYLRTNGYDEELDSAIIAGGLFPEMPEWYGTQNADRMRMVGRDPAKKGEDDDGSLSRLSQDMAKYNDDAGDSEEWLKDGEWLADHHDEWIDGQMNTKNDVKRYGQQRIKSLLDGLDLDKINYCMGEEEFDFNRKEDEKKKLTQIMQKVNEYKESLVDEAQTLEERIEALRERFEDDSQSYDVLMKVHNSLSSHLGNNYSPNVEHYYRRMLDRNEDELLDGLSAERKKEFRQLFDGIADDKDAYRAVVDEKKEEWEEVKHLEDLLASKEDIEERLNNLKVEEERGSMARWSKQYAITNSDAGELYMLVKRDLTMDIFDMFPEEYRDILETHISRYATVEDINYSGTYTDEHGQEQSVKGTIEEAEFEFYGDTMVIHNTKFRSNTATLHSLKEAEREIIYRNMIKDVMKDAGRMPKTVITPHGAGGFSTMRVNITPESRITDGRYREDPELVTIMTLPTFQSTDELLAFKDRGLRHTHTKRIDKWMHESGAVIQTMLDDGSEFNEFIHHTSLSMLGELTRELWQTEDGSAEYNALKREIEEMCARDMYVHAPFADVHLGAANFDGTPTNYERAQRTVNYMTNVYGDFIDELIFSELGEGTKDFTEMAKQVNGETPNVFRNLLSEQAEELDLENYDDPGDYMLDVLSYGLEELPARFTDNLAQLPFANEDKQYRAAEDFVTELVQEVKPHIVAAVAGNHLSNSAGGDEAQIIRDKAQKAALKAGFELGEDDIVLADSLGTKHGGTGSKRHEIPDKVYMYQHRVRAGQHPNKNIPRHIRKANYEGDEFFFNHIHTPVAGVVNGKSYMTNPAQKGPDMYALVNGYGTPVYGTLVQYSNYSEADAPAHDLKWFAWHHINDDTLEQAEHMGDRLDEVHHDIMAGFQNALDAVRESAKEEARQELYDEVKAESENSDVAA